MCLPTRQCNSALLQKRRILTSDFPFFPSLRQIQYILLPANLLFLRLEYLKVAPPNFQLTLKISASLNQLFEVSQQLELRPLVILANLGSKQSQLLAEVSVTMVERRRLVELMEYHLQRSHESASNSI